MARRSRRSRQPTQAQIGGRLRELRKARGLTQAAVAERIGVSTETVSRAEIGDQWPQFSVLQAMADAYVVELADVFAAPPAGKDERRQKMIVDVIDMLKPRTESEVEMIRDTVRALVGHLPLARKP